MCDCARIWENSWAEVDMSAVRHNYHTIRGSLPADTMLCCVVKANAYGHGVGQLAPLYEELGADWFAVSNIREALQLRRYGVTRPILILGYTHESCAALLAQENISQCVYSSAYGQRLSAAAQEMGVSVKIHVKLDTGMGRLGFRCPGEGADSVEGAIAVCRLTGLTPEGVFTHFVNATYTDDPQTPVAYAKFEKAVAQVRAAGFTPKYIHCCNTGATSWFKGDLISTHVRPGSLYMGYDSMDDGTNWLEVEEGISWRAFITNIHTVKAGESCGYCNHHVCDRDTVVATVDIGYADGLYRPMAQGGTGGVLLVNDTRCPYLATSMDQTMVDVTGVDCKVGDQVTVFGFSLNGAKLPLAELQNWTNQNLSLPLCLTNHRVKRIYKY